MSIINKLDPDEPLYESCKYDGELSPSSMLFHLLVMNRIRCCDNRLYLYRANEGRFEALEQNKEWHKLSWFFSENICQSISSSMVKELVHRLKNCNEIQLYSDELNQNDDCINVHDGIFEYPTGRMFSHSAEALFTYKLNVVYAKDASFDQCPHFKKF